MRIKPEKPGRIFPEKVVGFFILFLIPSVFYGIEQAKPTWRSSFPINGSYYDREMDLAIDRKGDVVMVGTVPGEANSSNEADWNTVKYSAETGAILWEKRFHRGNDDAVRAVAIDSSDNVIVSGFSGDGIHTIKYASADGAILWEQDHENVNATVIGLCGIITDAADDVIVAGWEPIFITHPDGGRSLVTGVYVAKYAGSTGAVLWEVSHALPESRDFRGHAICLGPQGSFALTGGAYGRSDQKTYIAKFSSTGALAWEQYDVPSAYEFRRTSLKLDTQGDVIQMSGRRCAKYAASSGALLWAKDFIAADADGFSAMTVDSVDNVLVTLPTKGVGLTDTDVYTAKYRPGGSLVWEKNFSSIADVSESPCAITTDNLGNVLIAGASTSGSESSMLFLKYRSDGQQDSDWVGTTPGERGICIQEAGGSVAVLGRNYSFPGTLSITRFEAGAFNEWLRRLSAYVDFIRPMYQSRAQFVADYEKYRANYRRMLANQPKPFNRVYVIRASPTPGFSSIETKFWFDVLRLKDSLVLMAKAISTGSDNWQFAKTRIRGVEGLEAIGNETVRKAYEDKVIRASANKAASSSVGYVFTEGTLPTSGFDVAVSVADWIIEGSLDTRPDAEILDAVEQYEEFRASTRYHIRTAPSVAKKFLSRLNKVDSWCRYVNTAILAEMKRDPRLTPAEKADLKAQYGVAIALLRTGVF